MPEEKQSENVVTITNDDMHTVIGQKEMMIHVLRRELEKRDQRILFLTKQVEALQSEKK